MIRILGSLMTFAIVGLMLTSASAQDDAKKGKFDAEAVFKKLDANSDGKLTKDEFMKMADRIAEKLGDADKSAKVKEMMGKNFDKTAGAGGTINLEQYKKMQEDRAKLFGDFKKKKSADQ